MNEEDLNDLWQLKNDFKNFKDRACELSIVYDSERFRNNLQTRKAPDIHEYPQDEISNSLFMGTHENGIALATTPDGNCLFNAVSLVLFGNENAAMELRLRTCIELALNSSYYKDHPVFQTMKIKTKDGKSLYSIEAIFEVAAFGRETLEERESCNFDEAFTIEITHTAKLKRHCGILQIMGLASVIGMPIQTFYPNQKFLFIDIFEAKFQPRYSYKHFEEIFFLLWTNTGGWEDKNKPFLANHFVPLLRKSILSPPMIPKIRNDIKRDEDILPINAYFTSEQVQKKKTYSCDAFDRFPLCSMPFDWYSNIGKNEISNRARDDRKNLKNNSLDISNCLRDSINFHENNLNSVTNKTRRDHLAAVIATGKFILEKGPVVKTQEVCKYYRITKQLSNSRRIMSKELHGILSKYLPLGEQLISGESYLFEKSGQQTVECAIKVANRNKYGDITKHVSSKIGPLYKDTIQYMDTKRDRDCLRGLISNVTSIKHASLLEEKKSRQGHRNSMHSLKHDLFRYNDIKRTSMVVRNDMTVSQQHQLYSRIITQRKLSEIKVIASGRGATLKAEQWPELPLIMEAAFDGSGMESHPRLSDLNLYRAKSNALTMKHAREILLASSPENFSISLSTCYNYTQNFKAGTAQAKRHHAGKDINACVSLHPPPRIGVQHISPNVHWTSANVNLLIDCYDRANTIIDSKDAKSIICADIAPVQKMGKTWKKREGMLPDHDWNQSRQNAVTPMTHLFLEDQHQLANKDTESKVRTGKAVTLINLSNFEPSSTIRCFNETLKIFSEDSLSYLFEKSEQSLKENIVFVVDNGPAEAPSSPLVQMLLIRLRKYLNLKLVAQVSFAEYNSKLNFVERVHAVENKILSSHGAFKSNAVHKVFGINSDEHRENMEHMAGEVVDCIKRASYGGKSFSAFRGIKDCEYVFDDEAIIKEFLSLSEGRKKAFEKTYTSNENDISKNLQYGWKISRSFFGNYYEDYQDLHNDQVTWKDKYTFINVAKDFELDVLQPVPDYVQWVSTGELHYLSKVEMRKLSKSHWSNHRALFLPTDILSMVSNVFMLEIAPEVLNSIAFLVWLPIKDVTEYLEHSKNVAAEEVRKDKEREALSKTDFYKQTKAKLVSLCKEHDINAEGTKLDIGLRLAKHLQIELEYSNGYDGQIETIPLPTSMIRKLGFSGLRSILQYHNISTRGTKDELVLKVALLKTGRKSYIHKKEREALKSLITISKEIIIEQRSMDVLTRVGSKRKFSTLLESKLSSSNPRKAASAFEVYTKSKIDIPENITIENIEEMFSPLEQELRVLSDTDADKDTAGIVKSNIATNLNKDVIFEIGAKVSIKWGADEVKGSGWKAGWFTATVQDFNIDNDWIKVEYLSEPGVIYKVEVAPSIENGTMKLKGSLF